MLGILVVAATFSMAILTSKLFFWRSALSESLLIIAFISSILEMFVFRVIAWWIYIWVRKQIYKCLIRHRLKRKSDFKNHYMVDISKHPEQFKRLFEKYPKTFITADINQLFSNPYGDINSLNVGDIYLDGLDSEGNERLFAPQNEEDRLFALNRNRKGSMSLMENMPFPQFNYNLPDSQNDLESMAELERLNKVLIDKMYSAYNQKADSILKQGSLQNVTDRNSRALTKLEKDREEELEKAKLNYNIAMDMFGIKPDEEEEKRKRELELKRRNKKTRLSGPSPTYYRDIQKVKDKRDLAAIRKLDLSDMKVKKKRSIVRRSTKMSESNNESPKRKPIPVFAGKPEDLEFNEKVTSSDHVEDDQVVFQSPQHSAIGSKRSPKNERVTSFQEQPHKYSVPQNEFEDSQRKITKDHFDALKDQFYRPIGSLKLITLHYRRRVSTIHSFIRK